MQTRHVWHSVANMHAHMLDMRSAEADHTERTLCVGIGVRHLITRYAAQREWAADAKVNNRHDRPTPTSPIHVWPKGLRRTHVAHRGNRPMRAAHSDCRGTNLLAVGQLCAATDAQAAQSQPDISNDHVTRATSCDRHHPLSAFNLVCVCCPGACSCATPTTSALP